MNISASIALVTGANRGIGKAIVETLCHGGVKRIYATARDINSLKSIVSIEPQKIVPLELDVTKPNQVLSVAELAHDVNLLVNNAGVLARDGFFCASSLENMRLEMETNFYGVLHMIRAFAPVLGKNGGGAIINLLSLVSHVNVPMFGTYSASKAAALSLTQSARAELASQGTLVIGVYPGPVDTDMMAGANFDKVPPQQIASAALLALEKGIEEVYPDKMSVDVLTPLHHSFKTLEKQFAPMLPTTK